MVASFVDQPVGKKKNTAKRGLGSIDVGMRLLSVLADSGTSMKLKEIAAAANLAPAKVHRYMASFLNCGMAMQDGPSGRYDLGPFAVRVGVAAMTRNDVIERASGNLAELRDDIRATCFVSCWSDRGPIIVRWEDSLRPVTVIVQIGSTMPLLNSATGQAYLAFMPPAKIESLLAKELSQTNLTRADVTELARDTKAAGFGRVNGAFQKGIAGISAPLYGPVGDMAGAVTAMGRQAELDISLHGTVAERLKQFARQMSMTEAIP
ncbi:MAG: IclR family transcriptional regulator [Fimbriimonadaceae bacterium]|nr:IclR family transcriptional regulator [Alphaproteobacteria bacterium]